MRRAAKTKEEREKIGQWEPERMENGETMPQVIARSRHIILKHQSKWNEQQKERAKILRAYKPFILAWYDHSISNGKIEGINNKIKVLKRQAYGYRNDEFFKLKLYALHDKRVRI